MSSDEILLRDGYVLKFDFDQEKSWGMTVSKDEKLIFNCPGSLTEPGSVSIEFALSLLDLEEVFAKMFMSKEDIKLFGLLRSILQESSS